MKRGIWMKSILVNKSRTVKSWFTKHTLRLKRKLLKSGGKLPLPASSLFLSKTLEKNAKVSVLAPLCRPQCELRSAVKRAFDFFPNARLKAVFSPAFQSVHRTRKQWEREASGFPLELSRPLFSRSSYTDLTCENSRPPPLGPGAKKNCLRANTGYMGFWAKESLFAI